MMDDVDFYHISNQGNLALTAPFLPSEIERVVKGSDGNKSLGLDSFNFAFFKKFCSLLSQ